MANTYTLIASNTLSSSAASVTFSSIPNTYTDLVLRISARTTNGASVESLKILLNGSTSAIYSLRSLYGTGSAAFSDAGLGANSSEFFAGAAAVASTATSNTFSSLEIYIPSYTVSQNKPISGFWASEDNSSTAYLYTTANLFRSTSQISQIEFIPRAGGTNFVSGSSFFLYGIKSS